MDDSQLLKHEASDVPALCGVNKVIMYSNQLHYEIEH